MNRFPQKKDFAATAKKAWSDHPPDWIVVLAQDATAHGLNGASKRINYSASTVSHVLSNSYAGDIGRVEKAVRGALMNETVACPVIGEIALNRCLAEQSRKDIGTSAARTRIFHKCRGIGTAKCPHSLIEDGRRG